MSTPSTAAEQAYRAAVHMREATGRGPIPDPANFEHVTERTGEPPAARQRADLPDLEPADPTDPTTQAVLADMRASQVGRPPATA